MRTAPRARKAIAIASGTPTPSTALPEYDASGSARSPTDLIRRYVSMIAPSPGATPMKRKFFTERRSSWR